jgi:fluoride exporter
MNNLILIGIGGAIGSMSRFLVSTKMYSILGSNFPYGTLIVNVTGSLIIGFIATVLFDRFSDYGMELRSLLIIGFLGGYTTFSSFSLETVHLFENGQPGFALVNIAGSLIMCLLATWFGTILGRMI